MTYLSYKKLCESKFDNIVSKRDKLQDINIIQLNFQVYDTYKKDEKLTNFEHTGNTDVINKGYFEEKLLKINGHLSLLEKNNNEFILQYNKQSAEEILIQRAVKTTLQILYDKCLFDHFNNGNAYEVLKGFVFLEKHRLDSEKINDVIQ